MKKQKKTVSLSLRGGSYSLILTAVVLALVMVLNVLAGALPENMTKYDMSATKLYSVTGNTRARDKRPGRRRDHLLDRPGRRRG